MIATVVHVFVNVLATRITILNPTRVVTTLATLTTASAMTARWKLPTIDLTAGQLAK